MQDTNSTITEDTSGNATNNKTQKQQLQDDEMMK